MTEQECDAMRTLLKRWVDETGWNIVTVGYWGEPEIYVCDWCREFGDSLDDIKHAPSCLVGQTLKVLSGERLETNR